jgi:CheY-like chemotaxis protein
MIVDDNAGIRRIIQKVLSRENAAFTECADGLDAVEAYGRARPDIVVMDIRMPRLDGLGAMRQIRMGFPDALFVVVSDHDDIELRTQARDLGAQAYVVKDDLTKLTQVIHGLV